MSVIELLDRDKQRVFGREKCLFKYVFECLVIFNLKRLYLHHPVPLILHQPHFQIRMSGVVGRAVKTFKDNSLGITMVGILVGAHIGWRWLQDQEEFVPKGTAKEYPWIEASKHYQKSKAAQAAQTETQEKS